MKTPIEAFEFTLTKVWELKESGIEVKIKPQQAFNSRKYDKETGIPPKRWCVVSFNIKGKNQANKILEMANYLIQCGISFDSGGCKECRDWELDWSFRFKQGEENLQLKDAREDVEKMLQK